MNQSGSKGTPPHPAPSSIHPCLAKDNLSVIYSISKKPAILAPISKNRT
jgi:hypothetical protein